MTKLAGDAQVDEDAQFADRAGGDAGTDLRATGERVQSLLDASSAGGPVARERAEELVRLVVELYGAGIERMLDLLYEAGRLDEVALDALVGDQLVSSLLLVHGLHPEGVAQRVERALDDVRPYLGSHGGDVELLEVTDEGTVRLRLLGSCDGCASSAATLTLAVEGAIRDAAPEVGPIEVDAPSSAGRTRPGHGATSALIPVETLRVRRPSATDAAAQDHTGQDRTGQWQALADLAELQPGELKATVVGDVSIVACRAGADLFAFLDNCPSCTRSLGPATLGRRLGGGAGDVVLCCANCGAHYDVRRAGASNEHPGEHLFPLPLLTRRGVVEVALPRSVSA